MYDTSVKVPMLISRPGHVPEGQVVQEMFSHYDLMPTLLDYVGLDHPGADGLPGHSFAPLLKGEACEGRERVVVFDEYGPVRMVRTHEWKYVHRYPYGPHELYDLRRDPDERYNLITAQGMGPQIVELRAMLEDWFLRYVDPACDGAHEPVTGDGQVGLVGPKSCGRPAFGKNPNVHVRGAGLPLRQYP